MTENTVKLIKASATHSSVLEAIHGDGFPAPWSAESFSSLLGQPNVHGWIAVSPEPCGFILSRTVADEAEILTVAVSGPHRRMGLGRRLLDNATHHMKQAGAKTCHLEVAADNHTAHSLYAGAGFTETGRRSGYYRSSDVAVDALVMSKTVCGTR